jgi:hypothetical protein
MKNGATLHIYLYYWHIQKLSNLLVRLLQCFIILSERKKNVSITYSSFSSSSSFLPFFLSNMKGRYNLQSL